ncbi:MAG: hypothetical protein CSA66_07635 [Proteobacteria bacterium]|nr:MAG: hypothetical protein CSA66_07635 [Pseudomonadota bacterium]
MASTDDPAPTEPMPPDELGRRLVYAMLLPAVRMALALGMPSKDLVRWAELAVYHEARRRNLKNHEIAEQLDVSVRKVAELSRRLKENFLSPDREHGLPRRIEFMLWAEPASAARIKQTFTDAAEAEIDEALATLEAQGRIRRTHKGRTVRYERVGAKAVLVQDQMLARIDGLNNLLGNVADVVHARFVAESPPESFARTISLRVRKDELRHLRSLYDDVLWEVLQRLDESAHAAPEDAETLSLSILWSPHAHLERLLEAGRDRDGEENDDV